MNGEFVLEDFGHVDVCVFGVSGYYPVCGGVMAAVVCGWHHSVCCFLFLVMFFLFVEELEIIGLCLVTVECVFWCLEDFCRIELMCGIIEI